MHKGYNGFPGYSLYCLDKGNVTRCLHHIVGCMVNKSVSNCIQRYYYETISLDIHLNCPPSKSANAQVYRISASDPIHVKGRDGEKLRLLLIRCTHCNAIRHHTRFLNSLRPLPTLRAPLPRMLLKLGFAVQARPHLGLLQRGAKFNDFVLSFI